MTNPGELRDLLSVGEVAILLGKPPRTVQHWCATGRMSATKLGAGQYVITLTEVERIKNEEAA